MTIIKLALRKLVSIRLGILPLVMLLFMTARTVMGGDSIMLSGLCVAFIPYFARVRSATCADGQFTEREEVFSDYLMNVLAVTIGMLYLKGLSMLAAAYNPYYIPSDLMNEMFWLTWICNLGFISLTAPVVCALNQSQRLSMAILLANLEIGAMVLIHNLIIMSNGAFVLEEQWGIALVAAILPAMSLITIAVKDRKEKREAKKESEK